MKNIPVRKQRYSPLKVVLVLMLILLASYGISEWLPIQFHRTWEKTIITENIDLITTLVVNQQSSTTDELTFSSLDSGKWQLSVGNHLQLVNNSKIRNLLGAMKNIVAVKMISHDDPEFSNTGLQPGQSTEIFAYHDQQISTHFFIGKSYSDTSDQQIYTFVKLSDDRNAYQVKGNLNEVFNQSWKRYVDDPLVELKMEDLVAVTYKFPCDSILRLNLTDAGWKYQAKNIVIDATGLQELLGHIKSMQIYEPDAGDLFWLNQKQLILFTDQLELTFRESSDPFVLKRMVLPDHPEFHHIFRNNLYPYRYYTLDVERARDLFRCQNLIKPKMNRPQKAVVGF